MPPQLRAAVSRAVTTAAIVDSDLPNVPDSLAAEVRRRVSELAGIPSPDIRISATHTHSDGVATWRSGPRCSARTWSAKRATPPPPPRSR